MEAYQQRVITERAELEEKIEKLTAFLKSPKIDEVSIEQRRLLMAQVMAMQQYSAVLGERIDAFARQNSRVVKFKMREGCEDLKPKRAHNTDAGYDLCAASDFLVPANGTSKIPTGLFLELPIGFEAQVRSRSGLADKCGLFVLNSPGTVDAGYRGEVGVLLHNTTNEDTLIKRKDRIAQMVFQWLPPFELLEIQGELSESDRGENGFGSTKLQ
jgi:dUTP pyrophosphatase